MIVEFKEEYVSGNKTYKEGDKINVCGQSYKTLKDAGVIVGSRKKKTKSEESKKEINL